MISDSVVAGLRYVQSQQTKAAIDWLDFNSITLMNVPTSAFPLSWPLGWPKPAVRVRSRFEAKKRVYSSTSGTSWLTKDGAHSIDKARQFLFDEFQRLGNVQKVLISSNLRLRLDGLPVSGQPQPGDPSIAVYFTVKNKPTVLACGKWDRAQDNLWAIAKHVEALRGQSRWGVGTLEQAFGGYAALPGPGEAGGCSWWSVLGVPINATEDQVKDAYRNLAKKYHPDSGSAPDTNKMVELNEAYRMATSQKPTL